MRLEQLVCGPLAVNTYIVGASDTKDVVVIDPGVVEGVVVGAGLY